MLKNIIFDMGNVLLDYNPKVSLDHFFDMEEDKKIVYQEFFKGAEWIKKDLGTITNEEIYHCVKKRLPEQLHERFYQCVYGWDVCMVPFQEAKEFVMYVKKKGYKIYVLSNASKEFYHYFPRFFQLDYFDGIVVSADIHKIKPDPLIYQYLIEKYQLIKSECLFIDDKKDNVEVAKQCGMQAEQYCEDFSFIKKKYQL